MKGIEGHARIPPPGWEDIQAEAAISETTPEVALDKLLRMRSKELDLELADPLHHGYEPPIWHVCDALLGFPWCYDRAFIRKCRVAFSNDDGRQTPDDRPEKTDREVWDDFCERMRKHLGYERPVKMLLIMGGQRASKSEYPPKRGMMMVAEKENSKIYAMHMSDPRSVKDQQPLFWKYMPVEWQIQVASLTAYIKYKKKTGFSENSFITPNGSTATFLNYSQDKDTALQGMEADLVAPDELIPANWIEDLMFRLATRAGKCIPTFTPINGYTPTVKIFCDGAKVVQTTPAYLCPRDGGEPDEARALHLTPEQYAELWKAVDQKRVAMVAQSEPEDVLDWLEPVFAEAATPGKPAAILDKRVFDEVPRVMRCVDPRKAVVFFNPSDNPYGNPKEVVADLRKKSKEYIRERFYGQAERTISILIPKFNRKIHVIPASRIPASGSNYFLYDPASDRNSFMSWFRVKGRDVYLHREWPGKYTIPGVGVPGPWAIPSGRKDGLNDGDPGEGQKPSFGFGNARYKFEMARLERWADWRKWREERGPGLDSRFRGNDRGGDGNDRGGDGNDRVVIGRGRVVERGAEYPKDEDLAEWDERNGAEEVITARFIDSRAASSPRIENDRPVTLQTLFDDLNVFFFLTPGADIADGVSKINSALDYELDEDGGQTTDDGRQTREEAEASGRQQDKELRRFINPPHFFVSEECENSIYALENWMNSTDGQNGACKDPIDLIRYFYMAECEDVGPNDYAEQGGVSYGNPPASAGGPERVHRGPRRLPVSAQ